MIGISQWIFLAGMIGLAGFGALPFFFPEFASALPASSWAYAAVGMTGLFALAGRAWRSYFYYGAALLHLAVELFFLFAPASMGNLPSVFLALMSGIPLLYAGLKG